MRERIKEILNTDFSADTSQEGITILFGKGEAQTRKADQILKEIREEIEKMENPFVSPEDYLYPECGAFAECKKRILSLLGGII